MVLYQVLVVVLLCIALTVAGEDTCTRDFKKVGCFTRDLKLLPDLLITDLDPTHSKFGKEVDFGQYSLHLHSLACRCRKLAQGNYKYFGIGMYGECLAGNSNPALDKLLENEQASAFSCVNGEFDNCDVGNEKECAGTVDHDFFYELMDGDCSSNIANGKTLNLLPQEKLFVRNTLVATLPKLGMVYEVSFEVKPTKFKAGWSSILHMTVAGNHEVYGARIPAVFFWPSSASATTNSLHICNAVMANRNHCYNSKALPLNKWIKIRINQVRRDDGYHYSIYIDNVQVYTVKNTRTVTFDDVKVYAADPWYAAQDGYIRNLQIAEDCYTNPSPYKPTLSLPAEIVLKQNNLVGGVSKLCKQYTMSFDVKPTAFAAGWHSILHVTLGGNYLVYGDRAPGIWFNPSSASATTNRFHICSPINNLSNYCYNSQATPKNKWLSIKLQQIKEGLDYNYLIFLDGKQVYKVKNTKPLVYYDLKVYAGDPWYAAQPGSIRNLNINGGSCE